MEQPRERRGGGGRPSGRGPGGGGVRTVAGERVGDDRRREPDEWGDPPDPVGRAGVEELLQRGVERSGHRHPLKVSTPGRTRCRGRTACYFTSASTSRHCTMSAKRL